MTFDQPLWLLAFAVLPALWWLHRRIAAPRDVVVASVEALRGTRTDAAAVKPRSRLDPELLAWLSGVACLVLAAAGPRGTEAPALLVVVDTSPSMDALDASGRALRSRALRGVREAVAEGAPDARLDVYELNGTVADWDDVAGERTRVDMRPDGLPGSLTTPLAFARERGYPGIVLVTDRSIDVPPGVVLVGPGGHGRPDVGVVSVVLDDDAALVTVSRPVGAAVTLRAEVDGVPTEVPVPADSTQTHTRVRAPAPSPGGSARYALHSLAGTDSFEANNSVEVERAGGVRTAHLHGPDVDGVQLTRELLDGLGVRQVASALEESDVEILVGGPPRERTGTRRLHLAVAPGEVGRVRVDGSPGFTRGFGVAVSGVLDAAAPMPQKLLAVTGRISSVPGRALGGWHDAKGALAIALESDVMVCLDPTSELSDWSTGVSFPVLISSALDHLGGGRDRLDLRGAVPPEETPAVGELPPLATPETVVSVVRSAGQGAGSEPYGGALSAAGAVLLALGAAGSWRRVERFSGGTGAPRTAG